MAPKRKSSDESDPQLESSKRTKLLPNASADKSESTSQNPVIGAPPHPKKHAASVKPEVTKKQPSFKGKVRKLAPARPLAAVSTANQRSSRGDDKTVVCVSRKTSLGSYLSRCKKILTEEGSDTLYLHAMGAAIPHLMMLAVSLPEILPYARSDIRVEVRTGTVEVMDELIPEDEEEDIELKTRGKAGISVRLQVCQTKPAKEL